MSAPTRWCLAQAPGNVSFYALACSRILLWSFVQCSICWQICECDYLLKIDCRFLPSFPVVLLPMVWDVLLANVRFASCEGMKMQDCARDDDFKTHFVIMPLRLLRQNRHIFSKCPTLSSHSRFASVICHCFETGNKESRTSCRRCLVYLQRIIRTERSSRYCRCIHHHYVGIL